MVMIIIIIIAQTKLHSRVKIKGSFSFTPLQHKLGNFV